MLRAMIGSTTADGTCTSPAAASAKVSECAKVNAVTWVSTGFHERLSRKSPRTNRM